MKTVLNVVLAVAILASTHAMAATAWCSDKTVAQISIDKGGGVLVSVPGVGYHMPICNVVVAQNGWSVEACKSIHSAFLSACLAGKKVDMYFNGTGIAAGVCPTFSNWTDVSNSVYGFYHVTVK